MKETTEIQMDQLVKLVADNPGSTAAELFMFGVGRRLERQDGGNPPAFGLGRAYRNRASRTPKAIRRGARRNFRGLRFNPQDSRPGTAPSSGPQSRPREGRTPRDDQRSTHQRDALQLQIIFYQQRTEEKTS